MKEKIILGFLWTFHYVVLPGITIFTLISGITLTTYSFKAFLFLTTGSLSISKVDMPKALLTSGLELFIGTIISLLSAGCFVMYTYYIQKKSLCPRKQINRIDPLTMLVTDEDDDMATGFHELEDEFIELNKIAL